MGASSRKGKLCVVQHCRKTATKDCPLSWKTFTSPVDILSHFDLGVCDEHYHQIHDTPWEWSITSYPSAVMPGNAGRDMIVIVPTGTELGKAKPRIPKDFKP